MNLLANDTFVKVNDSFSTDEMARMALCSGAIDRESASSRPGHKEETSAILRS